MENWENKIQTIQIQLAKSWGPISLAMMTALFTGYEVFYLFPDSTFWAFIFAFVVSTGLELGSFLVINTAIELGLNKKYVQASLMWFLSLCWCFLVAWVIYTGYAETVPDLITKLGTAGPFASFVGYVALTFDKQLKEDKKEVVNLTVKIDKIEADNLTWQRDQEALRIKLEHERELEELRLKSEEKKHRLTVKNNPQNVQNKHVKGMSKFDTYLTLRQENPNITISEIMEKLKVSRQTVYNWQKRNNG